ncbi:Rieske 2Fe-2S domain-containing protein, partial [Kitasatospora sp. NPDC059327]|uniref:Rieske 2Fe-2S domain-containing protein n=1 Tax=Kitasatospora sp. NPDC059327 TaxID=3346803 RepID=UPI0036CF9D50
MRIRPTRDQVWPEDSSDSLLPYPNGWFCVGPATEWKPKTVLTKPFMGQDIVVYRTARGVLRAVRPYCPHLGAHLGVGGTVDGELLVCPFHKFAFGPDGACAQTPYGQPPRASLQLVPVAQAAGFVWVWHAHDGASPSWELPDQ